MITSTSNQRVKDLVALQKKSKIRSTEQSFLVEGIKMLREVPKDRLTRLYVSETFHKNNIAQMKDLGRVTDILSDTVFSYISDTKTPQGILGVVRMSECSLDAIYAKAEGAFYLLLEGIQDPGNLGTILRTAEAAGVSGIIMNRDCVDIYNPKVIRSTMGSIFRVPFVYVDRLSDVLEHCKKIGITSFAADLRGSVPYSTQDYTRGTALLIGNESKGLTEELSDQADVRIHIPMLGKVESLNAAMAATILSFEVMRQRM